MAISPIERTVIELCLRCRWDEARRFGLCDSCIQKAIKATRIK